MRRPALAALLAVPLLLAGCGSGDDEAAAGDTSAASSEMAAEDAAGGADVAVDEMAEGDDAAAAAGEAAAPAQGGGGRDVVDVPVVPATTGRQLARSARIVVEVEDVEQAASQVIAAAQRAGGFISESDVRATSTEDGEEGYGILTLRVPAASLDTTVRDLGELGVRRISSSISTEDLTDQLTDVRARVRNLRALEGELNELLATVEGSDPRAQELLRVYSRIEEVRGQIERLRAQQAGAEDRVALATVTVELQPVPAPPGEVVEPVVQQEPVLSRAWGATRAAFGVMGELAVWLLVTVLPVLAVVLGVPLLLLWGVQLVRALARRPDDGAAAPSPPPAPSPTAVDAEDPDRDPAGVG